MKHSTPTRNAPKEETINFLKAFARIFSHADCSEMKARVAAHLETDRPAGVC